MRYQPLFVLALLLRTHAALAQTAPGTASIRRLAPASFPELPAGVRGDLARRGCLVPQVSGTDTPTNVIRGAFTAAKVSEWAIMCSVHDTSQVLIYRVSPPGDARVVDSLLRSPDLAWMQGIGDNKWGFSRLLRTLPRKTIRAWRRDADGHAIPQPIDHDAIEQAFEGKAADAFYYVGGRLYRQVTAD